MDPDLIKLNRSQGATGATSNPIIISDLLKTGRVTEERLTAQLRQSEADKLAMQADLGFFQQLIPQGGGTPEAMDFSRAVSRPVAYQ